MEFTFKASKVSDVRYPIVEGIELRIRLLFSLSCWRLDNRPMEDEIDEVIELKDNTKF